jgi:hypothetical protein
MPNWTKRRRVRSATSSSSCAAAWTRPAAVDRHAVRPQVHQERYARVVSQTGHGRSERGCLHRTRGRIEGHCSEQHLPIGGLRRVRELTARDQVDLVPFGVGEGELPGAVRLLAKGPLDGVHRFGRSADIEVDPIAQRSRLVKAVERDRRIPSQSVRQAVVTGRLVGERRTPERHHRLRVSCVDREPHGLQRGWIRGQPQVLRRRRDGAGKLHVEIDPDPNPAGAKVHVRQAGGQVGDAADERSAGGLRRRVEPGTRAAAEDPPVLDPAGLLELGRRHAGETVVLITQ